MKFLREQDRFWQVLRREFW